MVHNETEIGYKVLEKNKVSQDLLCTEAKLDRFIKSLMDAASVLGGNKEEFNRDDYPSLEEIEETLELKRKLRERLNQLDCFFSKLGEL